MADKGARAAAHRLSGAAEAQIEVIPHGIPDVAFVEPDAAKAKLGFAGRTVILTFGLLSPNKGIEVMIDAMPAMLAAPARRRLCGARRHPSEPGARTGRGLSREPRRQRVRELGIEEHVVFLDQFVDQPTLLDLHLDVRRLRHALSQRGADDVGNAGLQLRARPGGGVDALLACAGTARRGPRAASFRSAMRPRSAARSRGLLTDRCPRRQAMRRARLCGQPLDDLGAARPIAISATFEDDQRAAASNGRRVGRDCDLVARRCRALACEHAARAPPARCADDTGLFQHAVHSVPDRSHGYCVDDNARGAAAGQRAQQPPANSACPRPLTARFARLRPACLEPRHGGGSATS